MKDLKSGIFVVLPCLLAVAIAGVPAAWSGKKDGKADRIEFSGFLERYEDLRRADEFSEFVWGYTRKPLILRDYDKAMIDPVLVYFHPESRGVGVDPVKLAELTAFFRDRVVEELSEVRAVEIVDEPGPGVMRVRIALTDLNLSRGAANVGAKVAGAVTAGVGFLVPSVDIGGATMECEVLDSATGERLVAVVDTDRGRRMLNFRSMKSMGDAKAAMREWARDFRRNLQRIHEGRLPEGLETPTDRESRAPVEPGPDGP